MNERDKAATVEAPNPYEAPGAVEGPPPAAASDAPRLTRWLRPGRVLGIAVVSYFASCGFMVKVPSQPGAIAYDVVAALSALAFVLTVVQWVRRSEGRARPDDLTKAGGILVFLLSIFWFALGLLAARVAATGQVRGRQIRRLGKPLLPPLAKNAAWTSPHAHDLRALADAGLREALAAAWRENGRTEHASVAAFARLTLDLMALGAPPALLVAAQNDAQDEIAHAELCFGLARSLDGHEVSPHAFPAVQRGFGLVGSRTMKLAQLAVDSLVDGVLHEGLSARVLAKLAPRCELPSVVTLLRTLARDEGRHAAHAWDVVEWCVAEGGRPIRLALEGAVRALPKEARAAWSEEARQGSWERYGLHGHALEAAEYAEARAWITSRVRALGEYGARGIGESEAA